MVKIIALAGVVVLLSACGSSGGNNSSDGGAFQATYQAEGDCTTGVQSFQDHSQNAVENDFCKGLKDNVANHGCALYQRQQIYAQLECVGGWPYSTPSGFNEDVLKNYLYEEDGCATGTHVFAATTEKDLLRIYCRALKDEVLNHGCAQAARLQEYKDNNCDHAQ